MVLMKVWVSPSFIVPHKKPSNSLNAALGKMLPIYYGLIGKR